LDPVLHIPHTWGTGWQKTVDAMGEQVQKQLTAHPIKIVFASDILLYVRYAVKRLFLRRRLRIFIYS